MILCNLAFIQVLSCTFPSASKFQLQVLISGPYSRCFLSLIHTSCVCLAFVLPSTWLLHSYFGFFLIATQSSISVHILILFLATSRSYQSIRHSIAQRYWGNYDIEQWDRTHIPRKLKEIDLYLLYTTSFSWEKKKNLFFFRLKREFGLFIQKRLVI